jgi:hypothetical protein
MTLDSPFFSPSINDVTASVTKPMKIAKITIPTKSLNEDERDGQRQTRSRYQG